MVAKKKSDEQDADIIEEFFFHETSLKNIVEDYQKLNEKIDRIMYKIKIRKERSKVVI